MSAEETTRRMRPALRRLCCCSVVAASGVVAAYAMVAYTIALVYEIVWVVEAQSGLPLPALLLMLDYCVVVAATITLVHGLMTKNNKFLLAWLITIILALIPECALVFYMSINHWGLQSVYGSAELICYVVRLPALVIGVVLVQSCYALRQASDAHKDPFTGKFVNNLQPALTDSEFDASHYVPSPNDRNLAFINEAFIPDNSSKLSQSMPDLRKHLQMQQHLQMSSKANHYPYPVHHQPPPAYWQQPPDFHYYPRQNYHYTNTWVGPRHQDAEYGRRNRRHSVAGAFRDFDVIDYPQKDYYDESVMDTKSEVGYPTYYYDTRPQMYTDRRMHQPAYGNHPGSLVDLKRLPEMNDRNMYSSYGVNLLHHAPPSTDPFNLSVSRERVFYGPMLSNSHMSMGNESDDLTKYKDVAL